MRPQMKLKEKFIKRIYEKQGRAVGFRIDEVLLPNGKKGTREYLNHPGAVAVIPVIGKDNIVMVQQYRHPVGEITWEIPAGKLDKGEAPLKSIKRELKEETGYVAGSFGKLLSFWPTSAFANELIHIYVAKNLKPGSIGLDDDEFVQTKIWPLKTLLKFIRQGKIKDSKTIIALLYYWRRCC